MFFHSEVAHLSWVLPIYFKWNLFIYYEALCSKITAGGDCNHEIKRRLLFIRKGMTNLGFPCSSVGKESACSAGDLGSISGLGRSPGVRKGYPLQYSGLENSMDGIVHGVAESYTTE